MYQLSTLKNGLTLITIPRDHLDSVTTLIGVGVGSRYEDKKTSGISHFLEHMFFKGSVKYPTAEQISTLIDGIGAVNNAATSKEVTYYWIKSSAKHLELSADILSSMVRESLLSPEEIDREKGVISEELKMYKDNPSSFVWDLYEMLQFGDQPLGWDVGGEEAIIKTFNREDFIKYMNNFYSPKNMVLVFVGKIPKDIKGLAEKYFSDLTQKSNKITFQPFKKINQTKPKINVFFKETEQANFVLGVEGFARGDKKKYAARVLSLILGEGMSSRLFIQVRERRGLAYHIGALHHSYLDTGLFVINGGLKLEKLNESIEVIKAEIERICTAKVTDEELKKAKEMERGRLALRSESTNFLAEYFQSKFLLDGKIESFEDYLKKIDSINADDVRDVSRELFDKNKFNLQIIAPLKDSSSLEKILNS